MRTVVQLTDIKVYLINQNVQCHIMHSPTFFSSY